MNVYLYIAESNPDAAYQICQKYGYYDLRTIQDLSECLALIVAQDGESAFNEIMQLHPDKEVIVDIQPKTKQQTIVELDEVAIDKAEECSCKNAIGDTPPSPLVNHTNLYILIGALVISMAIIVSIKKG